MLHFTKMNGAGNDFVLVDNRDGKNALTCPQIARLCDRHRGIGADGLLAVEPATDGADFRMRYYNADGGEAEMCGNGARCFARFAQKISGQTGALSFETLAGVITANFPGDLVQIQMSPPHSLRLNDKLHAGDETLFVHSLNTGVPHAVVFVDDLENTDVRHLGRALRCHAHFAPKGTNANFVRQRSADTIAIRTYERGVEDETLACGTGMVACALIFHERTGAPSPVQVQVRGGETLQIGFTKTAEGYAHVTLTGPAEFVFDGIVAA